MELMQTILKKFNNPTFYINIVGDIYANDKSFIYELAKGFGTFYTKSDCKGFIYMIKKTNV